jgi:hypothetical protein
VGCSSQLVIVPPPPAPFPPGSSVGDQSRAHDNVLSRFMVFYNGWQRSIIPSQKSVCVCVRVGVCVSACVCLSVYVERVSRLSSSFPLPAAQLIGLPASSGGSRGVDGTSTSSSGSMRSGGVMVCPAVRTNVTRKQTDTHTSHARTTSNQHLSSSIHQLALRAYSGCDDTMFMETNTVF